MIIALQPFELPALWPEFWELLSRANEADPATQIEEVATYQALSEGKVVGFYFLEGGKMIMALTVEVLTTDRGKVAEITACGGVDLPKWVNVIDNIAAWAKSIGSKYLLITGRDGWVRVLRDKGFRKVAVTVEKAL